MGDIIDDDSESEYGDFDLMEAIQPANKMSSINNDQSEIISPLNKHETALTDDSAEAQAIAASRRRSSIISLTGVLDEDFCLRYDDIHYGVNVSRLTAAVTRSKPGHVQILKGITGEVKNGELVAIMGPSGAGKTSLLDILAYRIKQYEGEVTINGRKLDHEVFSSLCSYVPQIDSLWAALTVHENLLYAARLYRPSHERHDEIVDAVLAALGLEGCQDVKIGNVLLKGVSGGQKRRTTIGLELVSSRGILFLDEPTSGLDSAASASIMKHLRDLATNQNMIIVASIHQPSTQVFNSFDKLLLLSKGRVAYSGPADEALSFFADAHSEQPPKMMNPADWLLEITNADFTDASKVDALLDFWEGSDRSRILREQVSADKELVLTTKLPPRNQSIFYRIRTLVSRAWLNYLRDPASYIMRLVIICCMSIFLGAVYSDLGNGQQDILDGAYLIQWGLAFNSYINMVALPAFALERNSVNKEFANGQYLIYQYVTGNIVAQIPFVAMMAVLACTALYWIPGLNDSFARFVEYCIIMFGQLFYIESLAAVLATIIPDDVLALAVFGSFVSVLFIFNAFFVSVELMPDWLMWIQYLSPFKYAWEAMAHIVYSGQEFEPCQENNPVCIGTTGEEALDFFSTGSQDISSVNIWAHFFTILALAFGLRFALGVALVMQHK